MNHQARLENQLHEMRIQLDKLRKENSRLRLENIDLYYQLNGFRKEMEIK